MSARAPVRRVCIFVSGFEDGGVERNFTHLARGLATLGVEVQLLVGREAHPYLDAPGAGVRVSAIEGDPGRALARVLAASRQDLVLTGKLKDDFLALEVTRGLRARGEPVPRLVAVVGTLLSGRFRDRPWNLLKRFRETRRIRRGYQDLDGLTAVSDMVARDLRLNFGVRSVPLAVLPNPIVPPDHSERALRPCGHPWLSHTPPNLPAQARPAVVLAIGGLRRVKDFGTLLRAMGHAQIPDWRLLILGEGKERSALEAQVRELGLSTRVELPGFVPDPYPYLSRARLLVVSSRREGLANVVPEALAVATPVVATDCSTGIAALLAAAHLPQPVPVASPPALARAIDAALTGHFDAERMRAVAAPYGLIAACRAQLDFFESLRARD